MRKDGKILLQLRDENGRSPGKWGTFGGGIKKGEEPTKAIIREIKEELGIILSAKDLEKEYRFFFPLKKYYLYKIKLKLRHKKPVLMEGKRMKFMNIDEIINRKDVLKSVKIFFKYLNLFEILAKKLN